MFADILKAVLGVPSIVTIVTAFATGYITTWNAQHGNPIPPDNIKTVVESLLGVALAALGVHGFGKFGAQLQSSVPSSLAHTLTQALGNSQPVAGAAASVPPPVTAQQIGG